MRYLSTRDNNLKVTAFDAIVKGLAPDGGLYTPESIPRLQPSRDMARLGYPERAAKVMGMYLDGWDCDDILAMANKAYEPSKFGGSPAPVTAFDDTSHLLELWHGPTCAFKDLALQMLPHLLTKSLKLSGETRTACILTATSGDTGKAALEGFRDVPGTAIMVFYPHGGVSETQKLQMTTQRGSNVNVAGVVGNFDDTQTGVKKIFSDPGMAEYANSRNCFFSSANSINWGRVMPQISYYYSGYLDMINSGAASHEINVCVPTGNFGNILSAYIARAMGVPIKRLICASNSNDVLTEFINTGVYNRRREFFTTYSPSMDILVSSNLERMLYIVSDGDSEFVSEKLGELQSQGRYEIPDSMRRKLSDVFFAGCCDDARTLEYISETYKSKNILIDPHTAVACAVYSDYRRETGDKTPTLIVSTASPFKFCGAVLKALGENGYTSPISKLEQATKLSAPESLKKLSELDERFLKVLQKDEMSDSVREWLS